MGGDRHGPVGGTTGEQSHDLGGEGRREAGVLGRTAPPVALPAACPRLGVREAGALRARQRGLLDEEAQALVAVPALVEAHDDGAERTGLAGAAGERRVPRGR